MGGMSSKHAQLQQYQIELLVKVTDPIHTRLVAAYKPENPVDSMEKELDSILLEVLQDAVKESNN